MGEDSRQISLVLPFEVGEDLMLAYVLSTSEEQRKMVLDEAYVGMCERHDYYIKEINAGRNPFAISGLVSQVTIDFEDILKMNNFSRGIGTVVMRDYLKHPLTEFEKYSMEQMHKFGCGSAETVSGGNWIWGVD